MRSYSPKSNRSQVTGNQIRRIGSKAEAMIWSSAASPSWRRNAPTKTVLSRPILGLSPDGSALLASVFINRR